MRPSRPRKRSVVDGAGTKRMVVGLVVFIAAIVWTSIYLWQDAGREVQRKIDENTSRANAHGIDQQLGRLLGTSRPEETVTPTPEDLPSPPTESEPPPAIAESPSATSDDKPADASLPWWKKVQAAATHTGRTPANAQESVAIDTTTVSDQPIFVGSDDDVDAPRNEIVWSGPPRVAGIAAGDVLHISAPGLSLWGIEVVGVMDQDGQRSWLLKADGPNAVALQKVIAKRPKGLKISVDRS